jgi:hypothetical protein
MLPENLEAQIEAETVALNRWIFDEGIGLEVPANGFAPHTQALERLYARALAMNGQHPGLHQFALDNWAEIRRVPHDYRVAEAMDRVVTLPDIRVGDEALNWRNWREYEGATTDAAALSEAFQRMIELSAALRPELEARLARLREDFRAFGLTPIHTYCFREGLTPEQLRRLLLRIGQACRAPFQAGLNRRSQQVFGRPAGPAELHALYLHRMYEPTTALFTGGRAVPETIGALRAMGFDLSRIPLDLELRPRKYPGAYCMPIAIPGDVRVAVRLASPHYLVDMLYHELGHAAHFSGIRADLSFMDRYWIQSGVHETFSTLFEYLLGEPQFLRAQFDFGPEAVAQLVDFHRFKGLVTGTWLAASGLTALEMWLEDLDWSAAEARYAGHIRAFTGVAVPGEYARLEPFVSAASIYPAGYVLAALRVTHWLGALRELGGAEWWRSSAAQADIRAKIRAGGTVEFPAAWLGAGPFLAAFA